MAKHTSFIFSNSSLISWRTWTDTFHLRVGSISPSPLSWQRQEKSQNICCPIVKHVSLPGPISTPEAISRKTYNLWCWWHGLPPEPQGPGWQLSYMGWPWTWHCIPVHYCYSWHHEDCHKRWSTQLLSLQPGPAAGFCPACQLWAFCITWYMDCNNNPAVFFGVEDSRCNDLSCMMEGASWHASDYWTPKSFTELSAPWIFIGFTSHDLEHMCLTDTSYLVKS